MSDTGLTELHFTNLYTRTFVITDLEGSTKKWERDKAAMSSALVRHDQILTRAISDHNGVIFKHTGDGVCAVFEEPVDAVKAILDAQLAMEKTDWSAVGGLRFRAGIHTGAAESRNNDWYGPAMNRVGRLHAAGHGGQILVSQETALLIGDVISLENLGAYRLKDLGEPVNIYQVSAPALQKEFPPLRSVDTVANNLPLYIDSFVGRVNELSEIVDALNHSRLVTITGVGGAGKTRLSIESAAHLLPRFKDGVWLCELASVVQEEAVPHVLADLVGAIQQQGKTVTESIIDSLKHRSLLIILDNCEHVLETATSLASTILSKCSHVKILATSRESLAAPGENIIRLDSLNNKDGAQLFHDRARMAGCKTKLKDETLEELSEQLDGIPLAIEIAAARSASMTPEEILNRLHDRFRLLRGTGRGRLERHQTLKNTIAWSYDHLNNEEQTVFNRLSVFTGGFQMEAVAEVVSDVRIDTIEVEDILIHLVDRSMCVASPTLDGTRYKLLESLRQFAEEKLRESNESVSFRIRHTEWFTGFMQRAWSDFWSSDDAYCLRMIGREFENLRVAIHHAIETGNDQQVGHLIKPLYWWAWQELRYEVGNWAATALGMKTEPKYARAVAIHLLSLGGRFEKAAEINDLQLGNLSIDPDEACMHAHAIWSFAAVSGSTDLRDCIHRAIDAVSKTENEAWIAALTSIQVPFAVMAGQMDEAKTIAGLTLQQAKHSGNSTALCWSLFAKGRALSVDEPEPALQFFEQAINIANQNRNLLVGSIAATEAAAIIARFHEPEEGKKRLTEAIRSFIISGDRMQLWTSAHHLIFFLIRINKMNYATAIWKGLYSRPAFSAQHHRDEITEKLGKPDKNNLTDEDFTEMIHSILNDLE